jgi:hypothetical protein
LNLKTEIWCTFSACKIIVKWFMQKIA